MNVSKMGKRLGAFGTLVAISEASGFWLDKVVAFSLIGFLGPVTGGITFFAVALVFDLVILVWYKRTTSNWAEKEQRQLVEESSRRTFWGMILRMIMRSVRPVAYLGLSIWDPKYGFIYIRGSGGDPSFSATDWRWFIVSETIGNIVWILTAIGAIEAIKYLFF